MFTNPFRRHAHVQPQPAVNPQEQSAPPANIPGANDVGPAAQPQAPKAGHFELGIQPKSDIQEKFLTGCAGFQAGVIKVDLDDAFWSWIKTADRSLIDQAYMDGTLLSNEYISVLADSKPLIEASDTKADLEALQKRTIDLDDEDKKHRDALDKIESFHNTKLSAACPSLHHASKAFKTAYEAATGGDFKADYALYTRAFNFSKELLKIANLSSTAKSNTALQKKIATSKTQLRTMAIAVKRLEMAHTARTAQQG